MLKIERHGTGFKVRAVETGLGWFQRKARNIDEVANAVLHYYGGEHTCGTGCAFGDEKEGGSR